MMNIKNNNNKLVALVTLTLTVLAVVTLAQQPAQVPPSCTNVADELQTRDLPQLSTSESGFKAADVFTLVVRSRMVNNRTDALIVLQDGADACNYPSPTSPWLKTYDGCIEVWTAAISWQTLSNECGLSRSVDANDNSLVVFSGELAVTQYEVFPAIRGTPVTRELVTGMQYEIVFPTQYTVNSSVVSVFAPVNVLAAIVRQDYNQSRGVGEIDLFTSVQWPFALANESVSIELPAGSTITTAIREVDTSACAAANDACEITYMLDLTPVGVCNLTGTYRLRFRVACNALYTAADCPVQDDGSSSSSSYIDMTVTGEDLCGVFRESVDLTGQLVPYLNAAYATSRYSFLQNQTTFWKATVSSSKVSITASRLLAVRTSYDSQTAPTTLFEQSEVTPMGQAVGYTFDGNNGLPTENRFHFVAAEAVFPVPADGSGTAVVVAAIAVEYYNVAARKRVVRYVDDLPFVHDVMERQSLPPKQQPVDAETMIDLVGLPAAAAVTLPSPTTTINNNNNNNSPTIAIATNNNNNSPPAMPTEGEEPTGKSETAAPRPSHGAPTESVTVSLVAALVAALMCSVCIGGLVAFFVVKRRRSHADRDANNNNNNNKQQAAQQQERHLFAPSPNATPGSSTLNSKDDV